MYHLGAFYQSVDPAGVLTQINAVADQAIFTSGKDLRVPSKLTALLAEAALSAATAPSYGQVQSPTLSDLANQDIFPIEAAATFAGYGSIQDHSDNPRDLTALESVNFAIEATGGAAAENYGLVFIGDGAIKPTTGKMFSVRATSAISQSVGAWVNGPLTFNSVLPSGTYQVVGMAAQSADAVAARLVFVGGMFRPGVPSQTTVNNNYYAKFRNGRFGVLGEFDSNQPPTMDVLGGAATAQQYILDLIKTG